MLGVTEESVAPEFSSSRDAVVAPALASRILEETVWMRLRFGGDVLSLATAAVSALALRPVVGSITGSVVLVGACSIFALAILHTTGSPDDRLRGSLLETFTHVLAVVSLATMLALASGTILGCDQPLRLTVRMWLFAVVCLGATRMALLYARRHATSSGLHTTPTLIVGAGVVGNRLVQRFLEEPSYGLRPIGFLDSDPLAGLVTRPELGVPVLGGPEDLARSIIATGAGHVILAFSSEPDHLLVRKVRECQELGVGVSLVPRLYETINERAQLDHVGGLPLVTLRPVNPRGVQFAFKHAMDRTLAFAGLVLMSPVFAATALCVRVSSPGPILFRQLRVGRDGREFQLLKFRTMRIEERSESAFELAVGLAPGGVEGADRRTRIGPLLRRLSIDELPQLVNVLRGEMSLVGPRPERPQFVVQFSRDVLGYEDRHRVKSGMTGWAQVHGLRGQTSIIDRVEWDAYYIRNWSLRLDLRILAMTVSEIVRGRE
jgi:exopolysaccharide biosynthesis polyprenyl glycosylphosphotransferase